MIVKRMIAPDGGKVRRYTLPMDVTPEQERLIVRTREAIQADLERRAEELAVQGGYKGPGRYDLHFYKLALSEINPEHKEIERGLGPSAGAASQAELAGRHFVDRVRHFVKAGHPRATAIQLAQQEEGGLREVRAGLPPNSPWAAAGEQAVQDEVHRFGKLTGLRPGEVRERAYITGPAMRWHDLLGRLDEAEVTVLVSRGKLTGQDVAEWVGLHKGPKPVNLSPADSRAWDADLLARTEAIMENAQMQRSREAGREARPVE